MTGTRPWTEATVDLAAVPAAGMSVRLSAGAEDRRAIADRLQLPAVEDCTATIRIRPEGGRDRTTIEGRLSARLVRRCVVTDDPFTEAVEQTVECLVVKEEPDARDDGADEPDCEVVPDGVVDLAELTIQYLAVSMAAYPRGPDADRALAAFRAETTSAAGEPDSPFAGLGGRLGMTAAKPDGAEGEDGGA